MITNITTLNNKIVDDKYLNELFKSSVFFDIETTGLSHKSSDIISITALLYENDIFKVYQLFCQYSKEEKNVLKYFVDLLKGAKYIITYNGNSFDIPFIINKSNMYGINFDFDKHIKIDLYSDMRKLQYKFNITNLKLKTVEYHFNINREDTLIGQDILMLYEAYKIDPKKEFIYLILKHNYDDVINLPKLFKNIIESYDELLMFNNLFVKINYTDFSIKKNHLLGSFNVITGLEVNYLHPGLNFDLNLHIKSQNLKIKVPVNFFMNDKIKEFYFVDNDVFNLKKYIIIEGMKKNLIPIKFNETIFNDNIIKVFKNILTSIFE